MLQITSGEKHTLRELAARYAELANLPVQGERRVRAADINGLIQRRPMVWIHEIPWHEMDIDGKLRLVCENDFAREIEWFFRSALFRWEYFQVDMIVENYYPVLRKFIDSSGGFNVREDTLATDERNHIISHSYIDQLDTLEKVEALPMPRIEAYPEEDKARVEAAEEILGDILPVNLAGYNIYHAPWDVIPRMRGVSAIMFDLMDRPELMRATIKKFTEHGLSRMKQMETLGLLDGGLPEVHCTPAYVSGFTPGPSKLKGIWFRGMAQMFSDISPAMHDEFDLQYMKPLMAECGLAYYGCCEALDNKISLLKTIPNLRKIGVSPRANPEKCAEQIGGAYVYAHKPNPAHVAGAFDVDTVRREIARVADTCIKNKCPYEFVLKDISTAGYKPGNLIDWARTVTETLDRYYA
jgi:hypothetical protein